MPDNDIVLAEIKLELEHIKKDTSDIKNCLFGNGHKGLREKVTILEVKFWIIILLIAPISIYAIKEMLK